MKTMIKILTLVMFFTATVNMDAFARPFPGNRPVVKVLGKKKKLSRESSYYSLRYKKNHTNKCPKASRIKEFIPRF